MNEQINLRLPENLLATAKKYADKNGFSTIQEFIKETLREKLFREAINPKELALVRALAKLSEEKGLYSTEEDLFRKLKR